MESEQVAGLALGLALGAALGATDGEAVGLALGAALGAALGLALGLADPEAYSSHTAVGHWRHSCGVTRQRVQSSSHVGASAGHVRQQLQFPHEHGLVEPAAPSQLIATPWAADGAVAEPVAHHGTPPFSAAVQLLCVCPLKMNGK